MTSNFSFRTSSYHVAVSKSFSLKLLFWQIRNSAQIKLQEEAGTWMLLSSVPSFKAGSWCIKGLQRCQLNLVSIVLWMDCSVVPHDSLQVDHSCAHSCKTKVSSFTLLLTFVGVSARQLTVQYFTKWNVYIFNFLVHESLMTLSCPLPALQNSGIVQRGAGPSAQRGSVWPKEIWPDWTLPPNVVLKAPGWMRGGAGPAGHQVQSQMCLATSNVFLP